MIPHRIPVRVVIPHADTDWDYHQWVRTGTFRANCNGVPNRRMYDAQWQKWVCNNPDCPALALVSEQHLVALIDTHGGSR